MIENILMSVAFLFFFIPAFAYCFIWWDHAISTFIDGFGRGYDREKQ